MGIHEVAFPSYNGRDTVKGWIYTPIAEPRGIIQVVHGLGEHSRRYLHMILKMNDAGFIVCADDHVGHGKTAHDSDTWGNLGNKGYMTTVEDEHTLRGIVSEKFPNLPYFMFGHSWGSIIARNYATHHSDGMTGLIICGAPASSESILEIVDIAQPYIDAGQDDTVLPELIGKVFGSWVARYENPQTPNDWIAADPRVVADHGRDPFNNLTAPLNVRLLYDMGTALKAIQGEEWAKTLPTSLPVYNIAGDMDPAGGYGEGTYAISRWLADTGHKVTTRVYSGYRHEIHNEPPIRDEVEAGIIDFAISCL